MKETLQALNKELEPTGESWLQPTLPIPVNRHGRKRKKKLVPDLVAFDVEHAEISGSREQEAKLALIGRAELRKRRNPKRTREEESDEVQSVF